MRPKQIAQRFMVSLRTVKRLIERHKTHGSVAPRAQRHGARPRIQAADAPMIEAWLAENPSMTQQELAKRFEEHTGRSVSQQTVSRSLGMLGITRKKRR